MFYRSFMFTIKLTERYSISLYPASTYGCVCMLNHFSHVWTFATLWTVACQGPLSTTFSRQEYWSAGVGYHALLQENFLTQGSNPSPELLMDSLLLSHQGSPHITTPIINITHQSGTFLSFIYFLTKAELHQYSIITHNL